MSTVTRGSLAAAITLALGVSHAHATTFNVTNNDDSGPGSLRQALIDAAADSNIPHTINLSAIAGQTISTTSRLDFSTGPQNMDLSIVGSNVTVAGDGSAGIFAFYSDENVDLDVTISDLTVTGGDSVIPGGGILFESDSKYGANSLSLESVTITGNSSDEFGGGVAVYGADLLISDSTITNNEAAVGGGIMHTGEWAIISGSSIDNNSSTGGSLVLLSLEDHQVLRGAGNGIVAGIISLSTESVAVIDSSISGNNADEAIGGSALFGKYGVNIEQSTISGNSGEAFVGGLYALSLYGDLTIRSTTISGNSAETIGGGFIGSEEGSVIVENSTVSGNSDSNEVGGLRIVADYYYSDIDISFSTIVNNTSSTGVGGMVMSMYYFGNGERGLAYGEMSASGSIITGNLNDGGPSDLSTGGPTPVSRESLNLFGLFDREDQSRGGFPINVNQTLLGATLPSLNLDAVSQDLLGLNPLLGPLANNGGPTLTHLPGAGSPALNIVPMGTLGCGTAVPQDQRGETRPQDSACTLGSVEPLGQPLAPPMAVPIANRIGLLLMAGLLGLAGIMGMRRRRKPLG